MKELAALLKDLQEQHKKLEIECGDVPTYEKIFAFVSEFINGDPHDKAHRKRVIDKLVNCVYVDDRRTVIYFTFDDGEHPFISKEETDQVIAEIEKEPDTTEGSGSVPIGGGGEIRTPVTLPPNGFQDHPSTTALVRLRIFKTIYDSYRNIRQCFLGFLSF